MEYLVLEDEFGMPICMFSSLFNLRSDSQGWMLLPVERAEQIKLCDMCYRRLECLARGEDDDACIAISIYEYDNVENFQRIRGETFEDYVIDYCLAELVHAFGEAFKEGHEYWQRPYSVRMPS